MTMQAIEGEPGLIVFNHEQGLYVLPCGAGYSCLGFGVALSHAAKYAEFAKRPDLAPKAPAGTVESFREYQLAQEAARAHASTTGERCLSFLTPELTDLEGKRVEVAGPDGYRQRFWVGRSTGWAPIHLEIARRDSTGGSAAYIPQDATVRVVNRGRR